MSAKDRRQARLWGAGLAVLLFLAATHLAAIRTEGINMDEVALFHRVRQTLASGQLETGGRPGLTTLVLVPFFSRCNDAIDAARRARLAWMAVTIVYLAGVYRLVKEMERPDGGGAGGRLEGPALAVAALALAPPFLRWSLQVRSDQLALAGAVWGGVALLAARRRRPLAVAGGALLALGYLASQKAVYVAGLVGILLLGQAALDRRGTGGGDARARIADLAVRLALALAAALAAVLAYRWVVRLLFELPPPLRIAKGLEVFRWYREILGYGPYWTMLPGLWPQLLLLALLLLATARALAQREPAGRLLLAWAVLGSGLAVGVFHAGTFPYFWMTLGLFPAVAIGLAWSTVRRLLPGGRLLTAGAFLVLVGAGVAPALGRLEDSQELQRQSLAFIERHFPPPAAGYSVEGALYCRPTPDPLPRLFSHRLDSSFGGGEADEHTARFIDEFRRRPIRFLVASDRLERFPEALRDFVRRHYVLYRHAVMIPGLRFAAGAGEERPTEEREFEVIVPGPYRIWGLDGARDVAAEVDGLPLATGSSRSLATGRHRLRVLSGEGLSILALDVGEPPLPDRRGFFSRRQIAETRAYR